MKLTYIYVYCVTLLTLFVYMFLFEKDSLFYNFLLLIVSGPYCKTVYD